MLRTHGDAAALAAAAARDAAARIREAIVTRGHARIVAATGASQIAFLDRLVHEPGIDWLLVELFTSTSTSACRWVTRPASGNICSTA